jgi:hypothetical protein
MNDFEKARLRQTYVAMTSYYRQKLEDSTITMYVDDLEDLDFETVMGAIKTYRLDPKSRFLPLPAQIRSIIFPEPTTRDYAEEALGRVMRAIRAHGYMNGDSARQDIGEDAWNVIRRMGGWTEICSNPDFNPGVFRSQFLNAAESVVRTHDYDYSKALPHGGETTTLNKSRDLNLLTAKIKDLNEEIKS